MPRVISRVATNYLGLTFCVNPLAPHGLVKSLVGGQGGADDDNPMTPVRIIAVDIVLSLNRVHYFYVVPMLRSLTRTCQGVHGVRRGALHTESGSRSSATDHSLFMDTLGDDPDDALHGLRLWPEVVVHSDKLFA